MLQPFPISAIFGQKLVCNGPERRIQVSNDLDIRLWLLQRKMDYLINYRRASCSVYL